MILKSPLCVLIKKYTDYIWSEASESPLPFLLLSISCSSLIARDIWKVIYIFVVPLQFANSWKVIAVVPYSVLVLGVALQFANRKWLLKNHVYRYSSIQCTSFGKRDFCFSLVLFYSSRNYINVSIFLLLMTHIYLVSSSDLQSYIFLV